MNQGFYNWGLRIGSLFGITIRLHFLLLLFWIYSLHDLTKHFGPREGMIAWAIFTGLMLAIILLHELGHCFAARRTGGDADEVLLWPLGGLATTRYLQTWRNTLVVVAGGPLVNVGIAVIAVPAFLLLDSARPQLVYNFHYYACREVLLKWNLVMLVFNLIPLFPLDGGQLFRAGMWAWFEKKGGIGDGPFYHASRITIPVSMTMGGIGIAFCLAKLNDPAWNYSFLGIFIFLWAMVNTWQLRKQLQHMPSFSAAGDNVFGYDFSEGYTSLAKGPAGHDTSASTGKPGRLERRREEKSRRARQDDERRMDELFKKINDRGLDSLSRSERLFLEDMSKRMP